MPSSHVRSVLAAFLLPCLPIVAQCEPQWLPGEPISSANGSIDDSVSWDPDGAGPNAPLLIAAGGITAGQISAGSIAAWDGSQWLRLGSPPPGNARSVVVWNGNLVAAFSSPGNVVKVATWNGASWQELGTFGGSITFAAYATLAVHQGDLHVGGNFTQVDGVSSPYVVRWTGSSWAATGGGPPGRVAKLASFQNTLYAGCSASTSPGGQLATWNGAAWSVVATCNDSIQALAVRTAVSITNTFLYVGGRFTQWTGVNGTVAGPIVRFSPSANAWTGLGFVSSPVVNDLAVRSTGLTTAEVVAVDYNGLWQLSGASWVQLGAPVPNSTSVLYHDAAWHLLTYEAPGSHMAQRLQAGAWVPLNPPPSSSPLGQVQAVLPVGADTIVGSNTGLWQGQPGAWSAVGGLSGTVAKLARMANGDLVVHGGFTAPGLPAGVRLARWNGVAWSTLASSLSSGSLNTAIFALLPLPNGELIVGGNFTGIDSVSAAHVARWSGGAWQSLGGGVNNVVRALTRLPNGDVVAGGDFTLAGSFGNVAPYAARWDGSWTAMTAPAPVLALATEASGSVVALTNGLRRWSAGAWQPVLLTTSPSRLIALPDGEMFVAPYSTSASGIARITANGVARRIYSAFFGANPGLTDLALAEDGDVLVAGGMQGVAGVASVGVARLDAPCPATSVTEGAGCAGSSGPLALTPTALPWLGATFRAVATGLPTLAFGVAVTGFTPTSLPLPVVFPTAVPGCTLHVQPDLLEVALAAGGSTSVQLVVPNSTSLVGVVVRHQVVSLQFDAALNFTEVTATNSLQSTVGTL